MALDITACARRLDENRRGSVYTVSHGSSGFKASHESVKVFHRPDADERFLVRFTTPIGSDDLGTYDDLASAIEQANDAAHERLTRTVRNVDYTLTEQPHDTYPEGVPEELAAHI